MPSEQQQIPIAGEIEIKELSFKFNHAMTDTTSYNASTALISRHLLNMNKPGILNKIRQYVSSELRRMLYG